MTSEPASVPWAAAIAACPASIHVPPGLEMWFIFIWGKKNHPFLLSVLGAWVGLALFLALQMDSDSGLHLARVFIMT